MSETMPTSYDIRDRKQLLDLLMRCQDGRMTCLKAMEYIEKGMEAEEVPLRKWLHWAIDLIEAYDKRMIELGDPEEIVNSSDHLRAKKKVRELVGLPSLFASK